MSVLLKSIVQNLDNDYPHVLEFGVFMGSTLRKMAHLLSDNDNIETVYGFDSFLGLPEDWADFSKGAMSLDGKIPEAVLHLPKTKIMKGWFEDTVPEYLEEAKDISLIHIDSDLYSSAKTVLYSDIVKYIRPGTYIVFDEWVYERENFFVEDERVLFYEWVKDFDVRYEKLPDGPRGSFHGKKRAVKILSINN